MRQFLKRLLLPCVIAAVGQVSLIHAEGIRLLGPTGQVQSSPQYSEVVRSSAAQSNNEPSKFYGPTSATETLWSIASKLRPSNQVTVQQTLLALYQLNPESFELQNIHSLIPGSRLRIPSLAQIRNVTTEEATRVMQAHQQRLDQASRLATTSSSSAASARTVKPTSVKADTPPAAQPDTKPTQQQGNTQQVSPATDKIIPSEQPTQTEAPQSVLSFSSSDATGTDSEILALEEKNHRLTLMLSKVQSEVSDLKSELGDENKVRTEVEKLLAEERRKRAEAERMAPTSLDKLLSNGWTVGALALIPGLLIALLVMWLLGRRKTSDTSSDTATETKDVSDKPISIGGDAGEVGDHDDELDDLSLDDDLFSTTDPEAEEHEAQDEADVDDVFAELDDVDLDLDLGDESEEDLFASIDDDGDLVDTDLDSDFSASANGISVNSEDKAVGLEEMERALEDASLGADEEEQAEDEDFDLSSGDQVGMSQDEIETLLDGDSLDDDLDTTELDQSMLDDLLAEEQEDEFDLGDVGVASDSELDALFDSIEQQADLEQLEANSQDDSFLDEAFDTGAFDTSEDESETITDETTALLDELLDESDDTDDELNWDKELEDLGGFDLADEADESDDDLFDFETLDLDQDLETDADLDEEVTTPIDDGTELFDELLEIEQHSIEEDDDFNREGFIDDLISSAPDKDPLLEEVDFEAPTSGESSEEDTNDFDFNPEIEGSEQVDEDESVTANEFGVPQDTDWDIDEEGELSSASTPDDDEIGVGDELSDFDETTALDEFDAPPVDTDAPELSDSDVTSEVDSAVDQSSEVPEYPAETPVIEADHAPEADIDTEQAIEPEATQAEAAAEPPESDDLSDVIDDDALPEFDETTALDEFDAPPVDTDAPELSDSDVTSEIDSAVDQSSEVPEYTAETPVIEADHAPEADIDTEQAIEPEATQAEVAAEPPESDDLSDVIDDEALPEFDETAALSEADASPVDTDELASEPPETDDLSDFIDDEALPEFDETAALSEADPSPVDTDVLASEPLETDDLSDFIDDDALPEFDETTALDEFDAPPVDTDAPEQSDSDVTSEIDSAVDQSSEVPESPAETPVIEEAHAPEADIDTEQAIEPEATQAEAAAEPPESDDLSDFIDDEALPEFDETAALSESDPSPVDTDELASEPPEADDLSDFIDDEALPEFDETAALSEADASPVDTDELASEPPETDDLSEFIDDEALPEFDETAALSEADASPVDTDELASEPPESDDLSDFIDDDALPEFDETAALSEADASPVDTDELASEPPETDDLSDFIDDEALPEFDETAALSEADPSPVDTDELASEPLETDDLSDFIDDEALPEFDETAALSEADPSPSETDISEMTSDVTPETDLSTESSDFVDEEAGLKPFPRHSLDEDALDALLDENAEPEQYVFEPNLDEDRIASAGMDFESMLSMGGEDWNGFKLSPEQQASIPDEVPEEELDVWRSENQTHEPQADSEDWEVQDDLFYNEPEQPRHLTIDELMSQVEGHDHPFEDVDLKLDVGLNEFPDVIGDITNVDVDSNAEAAGKLDLAKIYIEMNDEAGAVKLLEEAIVDGNDDIRQAAKRLIDELNRKN
ncbi:FimV/HubP family polar landmark protein [Vibrio gazogenes]|uniref:AAA family ATPase n=1 Tax=Vibrio gazogenes TaxID=687 RepID=A0A1Z2SHK3_VIBGA|nr:FimV/HubP family polar landmark protein [Vibrio gazogenes]ASA56658.1 hypothetical protein BSQ33_13805 [Vibrio gazogenes]